MDSAFTSYQIEDKSFVAYIKRTIHNEVAANGKFSSQQIGEVDIIVSELASNLIKHARGSGELLYRITDPADGGTQFEVICMDTGPGISDPGKMMKDGMSTTNTLGNGLGAIMRLSNFAQLYSLPEWGTIIYATVSTLKDRPWKPPGADLDIRALCVSKPTEFVSGDGYMVKRSENLIRFFLGDGLGHGPHANEAVTRAAEHFNNTAEVEPVDILRTMHETVRKTRGLVATVAVFDKANAVWKVCGVGNISTRVYTGITYKNYMAYNGVIGHTMPNSLKESIFPSEKNQHLVMTSDGIRSRWELGKYPSILKYDVLVMAAALYKDFNRRTDDSSVLVAKVI